MTTQSQNGSPHLAAARELLDQLGAAAHGPDADMQAQASAAVAHSILVLAEQVAAIRLTVTSNANVPPPV